MYCLKLKGILAIINKPTPNDSKKMLWLCFSINISLKILPPNTFISPLVSILIQYSNLYLIFVIYKITIPFSVRIHSKLRAFVTLFIATQLFQIFDILVLKK